MFSFHLYLLFLSMFFISSPYFCFFCHLSQFAIWIFAWVSSLFADFTAFFFYLLSFLLVFSFFSSICLFMSLYKSIIICLFCVVFFVMCCNLHNINIIYNCLNDYLCFYFLISFCTYFLLLAVFYSCLYIDLFVALFSMKSLFFCFVSFKILYIIGFLSVLFFTFSLIMRILCFYIFA